MNATFFDKYGPLIAISGILILAYGKPDGVIKTMIVASAVLSNISASLAAFDHG